MACNENNNSSFYDPFLCDDSNDAASIVDTTTVVFMGDRVTYSRFFITGVMFKTMDGKTHKMAGMGSNGNPHSIWVIINDKRVKLTNTQPRTGIIDQG
jgi:hypothetical protein